MFQMCVWVFFGYDCFSGGECKIVEVTECIVIYYATFFNSLLQDPNWYSARNEAGDTGMIPVNYVHKREGVKLQTMP